MKDLLRIRGESLNRHMHSQTRKQSGLMRGMSRTDKSTYDARHRHFAANGASKRLPRSNSGRGGIR